MNGFDIKIVEPLDLSLKQKLMDIDETMRYLLNRRHLSFYIKAVGTPFTYKWIAACRVCPPRHGTDRHIRESERRPIAGAELEKLFRAILRHYERYHSEILAEWIFIRMD